MRLIDADELIKNIPNEEIISKYAVAHAPTIDIPHSDDWEKYSDKLWKNAYERGKADRPQGEWVQDPIAGNIMYCSNCKVSYTKDFLRRMSLYHEPKDTPNFCPNCGARMRGADDE